MNNFKFKESKDFQTEAENKSLRKEVEEKFEEIFRFESRKREFGYFNVKEKEKIILSLAEIKSEAVKDALREKWEPAEIVPKMAEKIPEYIERIIRNDDMKPEKRQRFVKMVAEACAEALSKKEDNVSVDDSGGSTAAQKDNNEFQAEKGQDFSQIVQSLESGAEKDINKSGREEHENSKIEAIIAKGIFSQIKLALEEEPVKIKNHKKEVIAAAVKIMKNQADEIAEKMKKEKRDFLSVKELENIKNSAKIIFSKNNKAVKEKPFLRQEKNEKKEKPKKPKEGEELAAVDQKKKEGETRNVQSAERILPEEEAALSVTAEIKDETDELKNETALPQIASIKNGAETRAKEEWDAQSIDEVIEKKFPGRKYEADKTLSADSAESVTQKAEEKEISEIEGKARENENKTGYEKPVQDHEKEEKIDRSKTNSDPGPRVSVENVSRENPSLLTEANQSEKQDGDFEAKIAKIKNELDLARKEYLEIDYKKKKAHRRLADFFSKFLKVGQSSGEEETDEETAYYRAIYDNKLFQYKNVLLEKSKRNKASNRELAELVKFFEVEAKINLADGHTEVKIENQDKKISGFIKRNMEAMVRQYQKLTLVKKLLVGAMFGTAVVASVSLGSAAAALVGTAAGIHRAFLGVVTGTGVIFAAEKITRRNVQKNIELEASNFKREIENLGEEQKYNAVEARINKVIFDRDKVINRIKNKNLRNLALGGAAGILAVSASKIVDMLGLGAENDIKTGAVAEKSKMLPPELPTEPIEKVSLTVEKGSSFQGALIEYIDNHQAEIYEHHPELKNFRPEQIAHRLYLDYLHNNSNPLNQSLDIVYDKAIIEINPASLEITNFSDNRGAIARAIEQVSGSRENWPQIKNMPFGEITGDDHQRILNFSEQCEKFWGAEAGIAEGEKIKDWIVRIVDIANKEK